MHGWLLEQLLNLKCVSIFSDALHVCVYVFFHQFNSLAIINYVILDASTEANRCDTLHGALTEHFHSDHLIFENWAYKKD